jgi:hypothetical protein
MAARELPLDLSDLTTSEKARVAWLSARILKRGIAGEDVYTADLFRKLDRVIEGARRRARPGPCPTCRTNRCPTCGQCPKCDGHRC